jgi:hypothetical protein
MPGFSSYSFDKAFLVISSKWSQYYLGNCNNGSNHYTTRFWGLGLCSNLHVKQPLLVMNTSQVEMPMDSSFVFLRTPWGTFHSNTLLCEIMISLQRHVKSDTDNAITVILPMPISDPKYCFWRKNLTKRNAAEVSFLLRRMCRIYSAATSCILQFRCSIPTRSITFAYAACIAGAICRAKASSNPSAFALHFLDFAKVSRNYM